MKTDCFAIFMVTKAFENEGDSADTHLVPIDDPNAVYTIEDAEIIEQISALLRAEH